MTDFHVKALDTALSHALRDRVKAAKDFKSAKADLDRLRHFRARGHTPPLREALAFLLEMSDPESTPHRTLKAELDSLPQEEQASPSLPPTKQLVTIPDPTPQTSPLPIEPLGKDPWPIAPLFSARWDDMPEGETITAVERAQACFPAVLPKDQHMVIRAGRSATLAHYPGFKAVELLFKRADGTELSHIGVYGETKALLINGLSPGVHEFNAGASTGEDQPGDSPLKLTSADLVKSYLRFFCGCISGDDGPFNVIETAEQLQARWSETEVPKKILNKIKPLTVEPIKVAPQEKEGTPALNANGPNWSAQATILYSNALFVSNFVVLPTGMIEMKSDTPIEADLPIFRDGFLQNFRLASATKTGPE